MMGEEPRSLEDICLLREMPDISWHVHSTIVMNTCGLVQICTVCILVVFSVHSILSQTHFWNSTRMADLLRT